MRNAEEKEKHNKSMRKWLREHPGYNTKNQERFLANNPDYYFEYGLKRYYKMTLKHYRRLAEEQQNLCAICGQPSKRPRLSVDHNHQTGQIRGLLCDRCNGGLAFVEDKLFCNSAQNYLKRWSEKGGTKPNISKKKKPRV